MRLWPLIKVCCHIIIIESSCFIICIRIHSECQVVCRHTETHILSFNTKCNIFHCLEKFSVILFIPMSSMSHGIHFSFLCFPIVLPFPQYYWDHILYNFIGLVLFFCYYILWLLTWHFITWSLFSFWHWIIFLCWYTTVYVSVKPLKCILFASSFWQFWVKLLFTF